VELKKQVQEGGHVGNGLKENMPVALIYLRELGSLALLSMVLYGAYDLAKTQGRDLIEVLESLRTTIENQSDIQKEVLKSIQAREARRDYERSNPNWSSTIGPPNPNRRTQ
jgi:hypothetical protein